MFYAFIERYTESGASHGQIHCLDCGAWVWGYRGSGNNPGESEAVRTHRAACKDRMGPAIGIDVDTADAINSIALLAAGHDCPSWF